MPKVLKFMKMLIIPVLLLASNERCTRDLSEERRAFRRPQHEHQDGLHGIAQEAPVPAQDAGEDDIVDEVSARHHLKIYLI